MRLLSKLTILSIFVLLSSCGSTKSTLKNVDNTALKPAIKDGHFVITNYSSDRKYGFDKDYPINLGFDNERFGERSAMYFFNALQGPNGEKIAFIKIDNCCPFPTSRSTMGGGILEIYEVTFEGINTKYIMYVNIFDKGKIECPKGFSLVK
jgi:hypothetical protein